MAEDIQPADSELKQSDENFCEKTELNCLVTELARDYSKYLKVDVVAEKTALEDEIEEILTRLDEFTSLVDMVRGDSTLCLNQTLPEIHRKCEELETIFQKVDRLEDMVRAIKQNLDVMEEKVNEAEEHLDSSSVKKLFSTFQKPLFSKKTDLKKQVKYVAPEIFQTEKFFSSSASSPTEGPSNS